MSIEGKGHFFTIYFPGFVCFVLYLAKISGERLQDHWSSGLENLAKLQILERIKIKNLNAKFLTGNTFILTPFKGSETRFSIS